MSQSSDNLRLASSTCQLVHCTQITSTVTRSQSNRYHLGCGGTGDSYYRGAANKSAAAVNTEEYPRNVFTTLMNLCHEVVLKEVHPSTRRMYLMKCLEGAYNLFFIFGSTQNSLKKKTKKTTSLQLCRVRFLTKIKDT